MFTCLECQISYTGAGPRCEQCAKIVSAQADDAASGFNQAPGKYEDMREMYRRANNPFSCDNYGSPDGQHIPSYSDRLASMNVQACIDPVELARIKDEALRPGPIIYKLPEPAPLTTLLGWDMAQWAAALVGEGMWPLCVADAIRLKARYRSKHSAEPSSLKEIAERFDFPELHESTPNVQIELASFTDGPKLDAWTAIDAWTAERLQQACGAPIRDEMVPLARGDQWTTEQMAELSKSQPAALTRIQSIVVAVDPSGRSYSVDEHGDYHVEDVLPIGGLEISPMKRTLADDVYSAAEKKNPYGACVVPADKEKYEEMLRSFTDLYDSSHPYPEFLHPIEPHHMPPLDEPAPDKVAVDTSMERNLK